MRLKASGDGLEKISNFQEGCSLSRPTPNPNLPDFVGKNSEVWKHLQEENQLESIWRAATCNTTNTQGHPDPKSVVYTSSNVTVDITRASSRTNASAPISSPRILTVSPFHTDRVANSKFLDFHDSSNESTQRHHTNSRIWRGGLKLMPARPTRSTETRRPVERCCTLVLSIRPLPASSPADTPARPPRK